MQKAIDCWINVDMGDMDPPDYLIRVKEDYLKGGDDFFRSFEPEELIPEMDRLGVERAIITSNANAPAARALRCVEKYPERFSLGLGVDPRHMMKGLWELEALVRDHPTACAKVVPFGFDIPPSDALYYPLYAKCIVPHRELGQVQKIAFAEGLTLIHVPPPSSQRRVSVG